MAEFVQNGGLNGGSYAGYYTGKLSVWENSYDINSNSSNVGYRLELISGASGRFSGLNASFDVVIDGISRNSGSNSYSLGHNGTITLCEGNCTVWHNADGSKNINCSATIDFQSHSSSPGDFYPSGNLWLSTIPRYTNVYNSLKAKTINSISINWSTTNARDWTQYSLNGNAWTNAYDTVANDNKSGYYTISNLNPNTEYTIKTRCRRTDSALWSEATTLTIKTYDIAKILNVSNSDFGQAVNINFANLENITTKLIVKIGNTEIGTRNNLTTEYSLEFTKEELSKIIKLLENEITEITYTVMTNDKYTNTLSALIILKSSIYKKQNGKWIKSKLYKKKNNSWKIIKLFFKVNGKWRNTR